MKRHPAVLTAAAVLIAGLLAVLSLMISGSGEAARSWPRGYWIEIGVGFRVGPQLAWSDGVVHDLRGSAE